MEKDFIQLPPLRRDTDAKVVSTLWEYVQLTEETQKILLSVMKDLNLDNHGMSGVQDMKEAYRQIPHEEIADFEGEMKKIISSVIYEACGLVCWVYDHKYNQGWNLQQMINEQRHAEKMIIVVDTLLERIMANRESNYRGLTS